MLVWKKKTEVSITYFFQTITHIYGYLQIIFWFSIINPPFSWAFSCFNNGLLSKTSSDVHTIKTTILSKLVVQWRLSKMKATRKACFIFVSFLRGFFSHLLHEWVCVLFLFGYKQWFVRWLNRTCSDFLSKSCWKLTLLVINSFLAFQLISVGKCCYCVFFYKWFSFPRANFDFTYRNWSAHFVIGTINVGYFLYHFLIPFGIIFCFVGQAHLNGSEE